MQSNSFSAENGQGTAIINVDPAVGHQPGARQRFRVPAQPGAGRAQFLQHHRCPAAGETESVRIYAGRAGLPAQALQREGPHLHFRRLRRDARPAGADLQHRGADRRPCATATSRNFARRLNDPCTFGTIRIFPAKRSATLSRQHHSAGPAVAGIAVFFCRSIRWQTPRAALQLRAQPQEHHGQIRHSRRSPLLASRRADQFLLVQPV